MEIKIYRKNEILYKNIHLKKLFDVLYQLSLRKHSAKQLAAVFSRSDLYYLFRKTKSARAARVSNASNI